MDLLISGSVPRQDVIEDYIHWASRKLMGKRIYEKLEIEVTFTFESEKGREHILAECGAIDAERYPRSFEIEVFRKLNTTKLLYILGHELTHCKQLAKGHWRSYFKHGSCTNIWHGEKISVLKSKVYWNAPWEIEARGMEHGMYSMWITDYMKRNKMKYEPHWHEDVWS